MITALTARVDREHERKKNTRRITSATAAPKTKRAHSSQTHDHSPKRSSLSYSLNIYSLASYPSRLVLRGVKEASAHRYQYRGPTERDWKPREKSAEDGGHKLRQQQQGKGALLQRRGETRGREHGESRQASDNQKRSHQLVVHGECVQGEEPGGVEG